MYQRRCTTIIVLGSILAGMFAISPVQAKTARYVVQLPEDGGSGVVRGYDTRTHHILWSLRNATVLSSACWRHDRRCFALVWYNQRSRKNETGRRFTIWYIGHKPHTHVGLPEPMEQYKDPPFAADYIVDMAWSPDDRNLLMRSVWLSGDVAQGWGILWHINAHRYRARLLVKHLVSGAEWISPTRISYWAIITTNPYVEKEGFIRIRPLL